MKEAQANAAVGSKQLFFSNITKNKYFKRNITVRY